MTKSQDARNKPPLVKSEERGPGRFTVRMSSAKDLRKRNSAMSTSVESFFMKKAERRRD